MSAIEVDKDELLSITAMHAGTIVGAIRALGEHATDPDLLRRAAEVIEGHAKRLAQFGPLLAGDLRVAAQALEQKQREMANAAQEAQGATRQ